MSRNNPKLSVIIATFDYRIEADYVASWTQRQQCADSDFEVIVVTHGRDPSMDAAVRAVLRSGDQLIHGDDPTENRMFRYNKGAAVAQGELMLFTEDHVIADPKCVAELITAGNTRDVQKNDEQRNDKDSLARSISHNSPGAWVVMSDDYARNTLAEAEAVLCQRFLAAGHSGAPWKKVQVRGFMITRAWFERMGRFPTGYGEFGATALGIEMNRAGCETQVVETARVTHVNHHRLNGLCDDALSYFAGEGNYRAEYSTEFIEYYLGRDESWRFRASNDKQVAKNEFRTLLHLAILRPVKALGKPRHAWVLAVNLLDSGLRSLFGHRYPTALSWLHLQNCKTRWYCGSPFEMGRQKRFENLWQALARYGRNRATAAPQNATKMQLDHFDLDCFQTADQWKESRIIGFHCAEVFAGQSFRWSQAVASFRLPKSTKAYGLTIQTLAIRAPLTQIPLVVSVNGRRLHRDHVRINDRSIEITVDPTAETLDAGSVLSIGCQPMRNRRDPRQCGLAVHSVRIKECHVIEESNETIANRINAA